MQARVERARALVQLQRTAEGLDDLLLAKKENPEEPEIHFLLAKVYRARGLSAEAAEEMRLFGILADKNKHIPNIDAPTRNEPDSK
jgi:predicted Zn-dependent protease